METRSFKNSDALIIAITSPGDIRAGKQDTKKLKRNQELKTETYNLFLVIKVAVIPVANGALGLLVKKIKEALGILGVMSVLVYRRKQFPLRQQALFLTQYCL